MPRKSLGAYVWATELEKTSPGSTFLAKPREHVAAGPVRSPLPMNPASKVWPTLNPNVVNLETGAWAHWRDVRLVTTAEAEDLRDHWRAKWEQDR